MGKKQIEKDFEELYLGKNQKELMDSYYKQKRKDMILVLCGGILLFLLLYYSEYKNLQLEEGNTLIRKEAGNQKQEVKLEVKREGKDWENITVYLEEKEYSEKELEIMYEEMIETMPEYILGNNQSLDQVSDNLFFLQEIEEYPFYLSWESSNEEIIDDKGSIKEVKESSIVEICVRAAYKNWEREHRFYVVVRGSGPTEYIDLLKKYIQEEEAYQRNNRKFFLPKIFQGENLQWKYQGTNKGVWVLIILVPVVGIVWNQKDREIKKKAELRREELKKEYTGFVSRLVLYVGTGISMKESIFRIQREYRKQKNSYYLEEELTYICNQMKNGLSEQKAYEILGNRSGLNEYKKIMALLTQQIQKGNYRIIEQLKKEVENANEEHYKRIKKAGEEMGTKLLFPMMLLLGIVMALIMIPAFYTFQI